MAIQVSAHEDTRLRRIVRVKSSRSAGRVCGRKSRSYGSVACTRRTRPALVFTRRYARACMCVCVCVCVYTHSCETFRPPITLKFHHLEVKFEYYFGRSIEIALSALLVRWFVFFERNRYFGYEKRERQQSLGGCRLHVREIGL